MSSVTLLIKKVLEQDMQTAFIIPMFILILANEISASTLNTNKYVFTYIRVRWC